MVLANMINAIAARACLSPIEITFGYRRYGSRQPCLHETIGIRSLA
jgi:hypothetical protein